VDRLRFLIFSDEKVSLGTAGSATMGN